MNEKLIIGVLIILALVSIGGWFYFSQLSQPSQPKEVPPEKETLPTIDTLSDRAKTLSISGGGGYPIFIKKLFIDPSYKVKEGERQYFSIWAKDPNGIKKVTATVKTDKEDRLFYLKLVEGTEEEGRWIGSWLTKDISLNSSYLTEFWAINKNGETAKLISSWYCK